MLLQELRVAEQRLRAVWEVLGGASVSEVARRFKVLRQSVPGRDNSARGRALKRVNRVTSAVFDDDYSFSFA